MKSKLSVPRNPPRLFRSRTATRFLLALAVSGPTSARAAALSIGAGSHHGFDLARRFERLKIARRNSAGVGSRRLQLNEQFFAYRELVVLLRRIAGASAPTVTRNVKRGSDGVKEVYKLLGTRGRTLSLVWIAYFGEINQDDLRRLMGVPYQSVSVLIRFWTSLGVVKTRRMGAERLLSLDRGYKFAAELYALLLRIAEVLPETQGLSTLQTRRLEARKNLQPSGSATNAIDAIPFGTRTQRAVLVYVAGWGPLPVPPLSKALKRSQNSVRGVLRSLYSNGLIAVARRPGLRNGSMWVAVDPVTSLFHYLRVIANRFPPPHPPTYQVPIFPATYRRKGAMSLPGSRLSRRVVTDLALGVDAEDADIAESVKSVPRQVRRILRRLASCGIVEWRVVGGRTKARLHPSCIGYHELESFVKGLHKRRLQSSVKEFELPNWSHTPWHEAT